MPRPRSAPSSPNRLSHCVVDTVGRIQVRCCGLVPLRVRAAAEGALSQPADVGAGRGSNRRRGRPCAPPCLLVLGKGPWAPLMPIWLGGFVHNAEVCMLGALLCVLRMLASYPPLRRKATGRAGHSCHPQCMPVRSKEAVETSDAFGRPGRPPLPSVCVPGPLLCSVAPEAGCASASPLAYCSVSPHPRCLFSCAGTRLHTPACTATRCVS